jgi:hypothetical protein
MSLTAKATKQELAERQDAVRQAVASVRLEGLEPSEEALSIFQRYASGELTIEEMGSEIDAMHDREYGPVPLSRNGRP